MLAKYVSVGSAFGLLGALAWGSTAGCSSSDSATIPSPDAGTSADAAGSSTSSSSSSGSTVDSGLPAGFKDPSTVPGVDAVYGTCPAFTKTDGSVVGSWNVSGGCLPSSAFDSYKSVCPGISVDTVTIKVGGTVVADNTTITRAESFFVSATINIDKTQCPEINLLVPTCAAIGPLLTSGTAGAKFDAAQCTDGTAAQSCVCQAQLTVSDATADTYTVDGKGTLTSTGAATRMFDYAPATATTPFTYQETTDKNPTFGMFINLTKQ